MSDAILRDVEATYTKATGLPEVHVGDTVDVHVRIVEGSKERIQVFQGTVIKIQGSGLTRSFVVRRIVANEGVERTFPFHSPRVAKVEVKRRGHVRRARLYYLRDRVGKSRRLQDRRRNLGAISKAASEHAQVVADTQAQAQAAAVADSASE